MSTLTLLGQKKVVCSGKASEIILRHFVQYCVKRSRNYIKLACQKTQQNNCIITFTLWLIMMKIKPYLLTKPCTWCIGPNLTIMYQTTLQKVVKRNKERKLKQCQKCKED